MEIVALKRMSKKNFIRLLEMSKKYHDGRYGKVRGCCDDAIAIREAEEVLEELNPREALNRAVNRAIIEGSPIYVNQPDCGPCGMFLDSVSDSTGFSSYDPNDNGNQPS